MGTTLVAEGCKFNFLYTFILEIISQIFDFLLHIDRYLVDIVSRYKEWTYLILFLVIFAETGFVVTPFLPGDALLVAVGAIVAKPESKLDIVVMCSLLIIAAITGDMVNYHIGKIIGPKAFSGNYKLLKKGFLKKTQTFYDKYGGKTIVYARFIPIIRTFAPFIAGISTMNYRHFAFYNIIGGIAWICIFLFFGYYLTRIPFIEENLGSVLLIVGILSILPPVIEFFNEKRKRKKGLK